MAGVAHIWPKPIYQLPSDLARLRADHPGFRDYPKLTVSAYSGQAPVVAVLDACAAADRVPLAVTYDFEFDQYTVWCLPRDRE